ncbi:MAG: carboxylesterase family protein [Actinomycetota bacterium]|nr:carboxylesterase family protein [Actinomycetota bacterium]
MSASRSHGTRVRDDLLVRTESGPVRGRRDEHARVFLNIPYAAPPVGRLRFADPQPHARWSEVRDGTAPGPNAPQPARGRFGTLDVAPFFGDGWEPGPDYLTLNVWAPGDTHGPAPVILFVHGGAFMAGSTRAPAYDGSAFARDGVVFVTLNYRLGIPGFLHLPDAPDNRGVLDVVAALRWLQANAHSFGGDPDNVTLAGQSAGAIIVSSIVASPSAQGTFRRAISQSGTGTGTLTPAQARVVSNAVHAELGVEATAATLERLSDGDLLDLVPRLTGLELPADGAADPLGGITPFNVVLEEQPASAVARNHLRHVDLLIGANREEAGLYVAPFASLETTTRADLVEIATRFRKSPDAAVAAYWPGAASVSLADARIAMLGDAMFVAGTRRMAAEHSARGAATYQYEFTWRPSALEGQLGATHLMELPFVFDNADLPGLTGPNRLLGTEPPPADLAQRMHAAWVRFAADGDPGWPAYTPHDRVIQEIGATWEARPETRESQYAVWGA